MNNPLVEEEVWSKEEARIYYNILWLARRGIERRKELEYLTAILVLHRLMCPCQEEIREILEDHLRAKILVSKLKANILERLE